jgi:hypothetical protein
MSDMPCKRFWEGCVGITISPRKLANGNYFWTFSLVRSYKRNDNWEYTQHFGQKHAEALGRLMSKAFQFMEQNDATRFVCDAMTARAADPEVAKNSDVVAQAARNAA